MLPIVARSARSRAASGPPGSSARRSWAILNATPLPARPRSGYGLSARCGLTTATATGSSGGIRWWSVTRTSIPAARALAISARLVVPQSTVTMTRRAGRARGGDRGLGQPVALLEPAGDVRDRLDAEAPQGQDDDREAGQPVGVEVAEHEDPLAVPPRARDPVAERAGVGQQRRVVEARLRRPEERVQRGRSGDAAAREEAGSRGRPARAGLPRRGSPRRPMRLRRGTASGSGARSRRQDARSGCTATSPALRRRSTPGCGRRGDATSQVRRRPAASSGRGSRPTDRGACRPSSARRPGAATALKIDEYVPEMMPISRARTKFRIADAAEQQQREQRQHDREAGHDRPGERLQDRVVDDLGERLAGVAGTVLADPVEDDDRVVDAEADDGQHRGHEQGVDLDVEERPEDRERADDDDDVVDERDERGRRRTSRRGTGT